MSHQKIAQTTPLEATLQGGISLASWLDGMARVLARAYEADDANWADLNHAHRAIEQGIDHLVYEGELSSQQSASSALKALFLWQPALRAPLARALSQTDKSIGRKVLVALFAQSSPTAMTHLGMGQH